MFDSMMQWPCRAISWLIPARPSVVAWVIFWIGQFFNVAADVPTLLRERLVFAFFDVATTFLVLAISIGMMKVIDSSKTDGTAERALHPFLEKAYFWRNFQTGLIFLQATMVLVKSYNDMIMWVAVPIATAIALVLLCVPYWLVEEEPKPGLKAKVKQWATSAREALTPVPQPTWSPA